MSNAVILAMDLGTTGNRVVAFAQSGEVVAQKYYEFTQHYPQPGWVEHDPLEIKDTALRALREVLEAVKEHEVTGLGITNQRETTILWERRTGQPIYPAIVWQCRRTEALCRQLEPYRDLFKQKTGLFLDPYFSGTKIHWILEHVPGARQRAQQGELAFGTVDSWLLWHLTNGQVHATEASNASRTLIFNLHDMAFDQELLELLQIPKRLLPQVLPSDACFGTTDLKVVGRRFPIHAILGDQQASLYAHSGVGEGKVKNTYGTGLFVVTKTGAEPVAHDRLVTTVAWQLQDKITYALEGSIFMGGAILQWTRDNLHLLNHASQSEALAQSLPDNQGVYLVPAFQGLGAPYWQSDARALLVGLSRKSDTAVVVRAALEAMAYQTRDVVAVMSDHLPFALQELHVDGGACANNFLMQFQADILGLPVIRPKIIEVTALGVAGLAGCALGFWSREGFETNLMTPDRIFKPQMTSQQAQAYYKRWQDAVHLSLSWSSAQG